MSGLNGTSNKTSALSAASKTSTSSLKLRLGFYEDLTTVPIVTGIEGVVKGAALRRGTLEETREAFKAGDLEVALLPSPDALRAQNCVIVPASAVCAVGASRMFMIFSKKVPTEIRRVLVDQNDIGGEALASMLMAKKLGVRPEFVRSTRPLDPAEYNLTQNDGFDAYLLTGRNCFYVRRDAFAFNLDLTMAYYEATRLPYVIHAWVVRKGLVLGMLEKEIGDVARRNESSRELSQRGAERSKMLESSVKQVYEKAFVTRFDPQVIASLRQFAKELTLARIFTAPPVSVYTPPAGIKKAGIA